MKNVIVAIDLIDQNEKLILEKAIELTSCFNPKYWILHITAPDPDFVGYEAGPQSVRDNLANELRKKHRSIQEYKDKLEEGGYIAESLLIQGPTLEMILDKSNKLKADLLIIGHKDHSLLYKTFIGELSTQLINKSKIPLIIIPLE